MRSRSAVGWAMMVLVGVAAACGSDGDGDQLECGPGTVAIDGTCTVVSGGEGGSDHGGSDHGGSTSGAGNGGAKPTAGTANVAGSDAAGGSGGEPAVGGEGGGAGSGTEEPPLPSTRWLVFSHEKGVFAYDTQKFPEQTGLIPLSTKTQSPWYYGLTWSPDKRTLAYNDAGTIYARDLSGDTPGTARLLVAAPSPGSIMAGKAVSWSGDSTWLATLSGSTTLVVVDTRLAAPKVHTLSTKIEWYAWSPTGNRIGYADDTGTHVVTVGDNELGPSLKLDDGAFSWSPNGEQLVGVTAEGTLTLTTLSEGSASVEELAGPTIGGGAGGAASDPPSPSYNFYFNRDGSQLLLTATRDGTAFKAYTVRITPSPQAPKLVNMGATADASTSCQSWSTDESLVLCNWWANSQSHFTAASVEGGSPSADLPEAVGHDAVWSPAAARHQLFFTSAGAHRMVDVAEPDRSIELGLATTVAFPSFRLNPSGTIFSYVDDLTVRLVDLADTEAPTIDIAAAPNGNEPPTWGWSGDGKFIVTADDQAQLSLVRIDDFNASTPVALEGKSKAKIFFAWQ